MITKKSYIPLLRSEHSGNTPIASLYMSIVASTIPTADRMAILSDNMR
jgi:hypothetical protein